MRKLAALFLFFGIMFACSNAQSKPFETFACSTFEDAKTVIDMEIDEGAEKAVIFMVSLAKKRKCIPFLMTVYNDSVVAYEREMKNGDLVIIIEKAIGGGKVAYVIVTLPRKSRGA